MKQSNHSPSSLSSFKKRRKISVSTPAKRNRVSIHRVWKPGGEEGEREVTESVKSVSSEDGNQTRSTERRESKAGMGHVFQKARFGGLETKTKRGNKQWISDAMMKEKLEVKKKRSSEEVDKDRRHERVRWNKRRKCHVVSIQGNQYMMSKRGKSLKRVINTAGSKSVIHVHVHIHVYLYLYLYIHVYVHVLVCTCICTCTCMYLYEHVHVYVYVHVYVLVSTCTLYMYLYVLGDSKFQMQPKRYCTCSITFLNMYEVYEHIVYM